MIEKVTGLSDFAYREGISSVKNDFGVKNYNKDFDNSKTS